MLSPASRRGGREAHTGSGRQPERADDVQECEWRAGATEQGFGAGTEIGCRDAQRPGDDRREEKLSRRDILGENEEPVEDGAHGEEDEGVDE